MGSAPTDEPIAAGPAGREPRAGARGAPLGRPEIWIPLLYIALSATWITLSDRLVELASASQGEQSAWSTAKGLLFVLTTGALLHLGVRLALRRERRAYDRLAEREALLRAIADTIPDPIFLKDRESRWLFANPASLAAVGRAEAETLGRNDVELYPDPAVAAALVAADRRVMDSGQPELLEERVDTAAGPRTYLSSKAPYRDAAGRIAGVIGVARDITERKAAEAALRASEERLHQAQKLESVGRLAGGVAHDFNNLLTVILSGAEALRGSVRDGRAPSLEDVEEIHAAGRRAAELTGRLLAFARKQPITPVSLDLNGLVRGAERLLARVLGEDVTLEVRLAPDLWPTLCDPGQLEQVLLNLAVNARDAMPRGGTLTLATRNAPRAPGATEGDAVALVVSDSGTGMGPEVISHVFEPFFTTKPPGQGTGLGLATVYGIVHQAGGQVHVESAPGRGTRFEVLLPRHAGPIPAAAPAAGEAAPRGSETILAVEDDPLVREVIVRSLRGAGYRVIVAAGWPEAQGLLDAGEAPRLLVADVVLPGMDGRAVADEVRRRHPGTSVLFVSGYTREVIHQHGVLDSGIEFLPKPFTPSALLQRVRAALDAPGASQPQRAGR